VEAFAGETGSEEGNPEVLVSRKTAVEVGWYHPHILTFIVLASPLARERPSWSVVAEPWPDDVTPKKPQSVDVSTVKDAALKNKEENGAPQRPKTREGRQLPPPPARLPPPRNLPPPPRNPPVL
jgi:hypothetical protein